MGDRSEQRDVESTQVPLGAALESAGNLLVLQRRSESELHRAKDRAERELDTSRNLLHHLVSESPAVLYALRLEGDSIALAWISENVERLLGVTAEEALVPGWWLDRLHPEDSAQILAELPGLLASGRLSQEYRLRRSDGTYLWLHDEARVLRDALGRPSEVVGSWSDITARKGAEQKLVESAAEGRLLFDSNPHPMWVFDAETLAFLAVNDAAIALYGFSREEFLGMTIQEIRPAGEVPALLEYLATIPDALSLTATQIKHCKKDGSLLEVAGASSPIEFRGRRARLVLATDVSEKRRLEAQLSQAQRMEAVGRLAGGIAHDFNNLLGVILGYGELLITGAGEAQREDLEQILKAGHSAADLTRQLLAFSRNQIVDPKVLDLNALLSDLEKMLGRVLGEDIDLTIVAGAKLGQVKADRGQLEQVVMNLCANARDAMPDGGALRIETANAELEAPRVPHDGPLAPGRYVVLSISDAGRGIDRQILDNIFEPFFTTKELGKGTGLGLAMVYGVVKQAGGHVWVESEPGRGTTFRIYLPRVDEPVAAAARVDASLPPRGWQTILLVEDEGSLRALARKILEGHGYRVIAAASANEAIAAASRHPEVIHLLLTDVVMPGMNGRKLAEAMVIARPEIKVLYMSGYTDDVIAHHGVLAPGTLLLEKPFTVLALLRHVGEALRPIPSG